jgi:hypothetical protein
MTRLAASEIRARRRPFAIALVWAFRLVAAYLIASPLADLFQALGAGRAPLGDAALFEPGALLLIEALRLQMPALAPALRTGFAVFLFASLVSLLPLSALYVALASGGRLRAGEWCAGAVECLPRFVLLGGLSLLCQAGIILAFTMVHGLLRPMLAATLTERGTDVGSILLFSIAGAAVLTIGVVHDLARAASVHGAATAGRAVREALSTFRRARAAVIAGWLVPALTSGAIVGLAAFVVASLQLERGGAARFALATSVHQAAAFALVALRANWIARSLRLVGSG